MKQPPIDRRLVPPALWVLFVVAVLFARHFHRADVRGAAALGVVVAIGIALWLLVVGGGRIASPRDRTLARAIPLAAPILATIVALGGALRAPALVLAATVPLAVGWRRGPRRAIVSALGMLASLGAAHWHLRGAPSAATLLNAALIIGLASVLPVWIRERERRAVARERKRVEALNGFLSDRRSTPLSVPTLAAIGDELGTVETGVDASPVIGAYLADVRDSLGADAAVFWGLDEREGVLRPISWSQLGDDSLPGEPPALVSWSAAQGMAQVVEEDGTARMAVAPVGAGGHRVGALSIASAAGFALPPADVRAWLDRYAAHVAVLGGLVVAQRENVRRARRHETLLYETRNFQAAASEGELAELVCATAMQLCSADRAALASWDADECHGEVRATTAGHRVGAGLAVSDASRVGETCSARLAASWPDGRAAVEETPLFSRGEPPVVQGSLVIVPLLRDAVVIGALVLESDAVHALSLRDARNLRVLGEIAALALDSRRGADEAVRSARTDPLTGVANRRRFDERLAEILAEADRYGVPTSLLVVDVDHFKRVNDGHGHDAGDEVLRAVAHRLGEGVRAVDVLARYGGEEFVLLLPHTDSTDAALIAERLRSAIERAPVRAGSALIPVTASVGVATFPRHTPSRDGLFAAADRALYDAKEAGRNRVCVAPVAARGAVGG